MKKMHLSALSLAAFLLIGGLTACARPGDAAGSTHHSLSPRSINAPGAAAVSQFQPTNPATAAPNQAYIMETINALCVEPRPIGSQAEHRAAQYLQQRLTSYGYRSELQTFPYNITSTTQSDRYRQARELTGRDFFDAVLPGTQKDGDSQNVIGRHAWEADKEKVFILSAHYDSTANSIGVVDNAAGVAVVLEAARILAEEDLPFSVRVVFFGGEESILFGSRNYLINMDQTELGRIVGNINVDTVAYSAEEVFEVLTPLTLARQDVQTLKQASPVAAALLSDSRVKPAYESPLVGDHMSFSQAGVDSVNFGQSMEAVRGIINSPSDTYDLLKPELLPVATQLLVDAVREVAAQMA